jgi:hypothetical protein
MAPVELDMVGWDNSLPLPTGFCSFVPFQYTDDIYGVVPVTHSFRMNAYLSKDGVQKVEIRNTSLVTRPVLAQVVDGSSRGPVSEILDMLERRMTQIMPATKATYLKLDHASTAPSSEFTRTHSFVSIRKVPDMAPIDYVRLGLESLTNDTPHDALTASQHTFFASPTATEVLAHINPQVAAYHARFFDENKVHMEAQFKQGQARYDVFKTLSLPEMARRVRRRMENSYTFVGLGSPSEILPKDPKS